MDTSCSMLTWASTRWMRSSGPTGLTWTQKSGWASSSSLSSRLWSTQRVNSGSLVLTRRSFVISGAP